MNPDEPSEISRTTKPPGQGRTPGEVLNLLLETQAGSERAYIELDRCLDEGVSLVATYAWLLLMAANGADIAEAALLQHRSILAPEEIEEAEALVEQYANPESCPADDDLSGWFADVNQVLADTLARQEGQTLTSGEIEALLTRADADDQEAQRVLEPMLENLKGQMTAEEMKRLERQIVDLLPEV